MDSSNTPMKMSEAEHTSLAQDWFVTLRHWLSNRWVLIGIAAVAIVAGATFSWGWLVAAGIAPLLLTAGPCIAMCALGLCMNIGKKGGASCSKETAVDGKTDGDTLPATTPSERRARAPE